MKLIHSPFGTADAVVTGRYGNWRGREGLLLRRLGEDGTEEDGEITSPVYGRIANVVPDAPSGRLTAVLEADCGLTVLLSGLKTVLPRVGARLFVGERLGESGGEVGLVIRRGEYSVEPAELLGIQNMEGAVLPGRKSPPRKGRENGEKEGPRFAPGDTVRILRPVRYGTGHRFPSDGGIYEVIGVCGDRVTVGRAGREIAFVRDTDLEAVR